MLFGENGHKGVDNVVVQIIDVIDVRDPTCSVAFWTYIPLGINVLNI